VVLMIYCSALPTASALTLTTPADRRAAPRRAADVAVLASHPRFATQPRTAHLLA